MLDRTYYRFLHIGGSEFRWAHCLELPTAFVRDCTEMTDDEFNDYATPYAGRLPPSKEPRAKG